MVNEIDSMEQLSTTPNYTTSSTYLSGWPQIRAWSGSHVFPLDWLLVTQLIPSISAFRLLDLVSSLALWWFDVDFVAYVYGPTITALLQTPKLKAQDSATCYGGWKDKDNDDSSSGDDRTLLAFHWDQIHLFVSSLTTL